MPKHRTMLACQILRSPRFAQGSPAREELERRLAPETRDTLDRLLPSGWWEEAQTVELVHAALDVLGLHDDAAIHRYMRDQIVPAYSKIYRTLFGFVPPQLIVQRAPWFWRRQHDTGEMVVDAAQDGGATLRVVGNTYVAERIYALGVLAATESVLRLSRATAVSGKYEILGPAEVRFDFAWGARASEEG